MQQPGAQSQLTIARNNQQVNVPVTLGSRESFTWRGQSEDRWGGGGWGGQSGQWSDQSRVLRLIPGLESAEFVRLGMVHRNTYINGPTVLRDTWQTRARADLLFAGQVSGVEGYVESAASGLIAGRNAAALALGEPPASPPRTTAIGALAYYVSHAEAKHYQPSNITFGIMPPLDDTGSGRPKKGGERREAMAVRALLDLERWQAAREGGAVGVAAPAGAGI